MATYTVRSEAANPCPRECPSFGNISHDSVGMVAPFAIFGLTKSGFGHQNDFIRSPHFERNPTDATCIRFDRRSSLHFCCSRPSRARRRQHIAGASMFWCLTNRLAGSTSERTIRTGFHGNRSRTVPNSHGVSPVRKANRLPAERSPALTS